MTRQRNFSRSHEAPFICSDCKMHLYPVLCPLCTGDGCEQCDGTGSIIACIWCTRQIEYST